MRTLLTLILITLFSCSTKGIKEPERIGFQVLVILKNLDKNGKQGYIDSHCTYGQIKKFVHPEKIGNREDWILYIEDRYTKIKKFGHRWNIDWQAIEYVDFDFEINEKRGVKECEGVLHFKFKDGLRYQYNIEATLKVSSILRNNVYQLAELRQIRLYSNFGF